MFGVELRRQKVSLYYVIIYIKEIVTDITLRDVTEMVTG